MTDADDPYPRRWEADVVLRDGRVAHLRPIRSSDGPGLVEFYEGVSDESRYLRFFAPMPRLSDRDVHRFTHVDHDRRVGLVLTIGEQIIAFGQYEGVPKGEECDGPVEAEVAFLVQDAHQGRGIGQLLLEHLAQAARERDIDLFRAEILPGNQAMIGVFQDAGYTIGRAFEDGVMSLHFSIEKTQTSLDVMQAREHRAEATSVERFLSASSVAVVGASRRTDSIGRTLVRNLVLGDFQGRVYAVNSAAEAVAGMPAYAAVSDIPDVVDIALVAVPAESVPEVVLDCANKGVHGIVVVSSGFAETGDEGRRQQRRFVGLARGYGLRVVGPNALGIINTGSGVRLNASLSPVMPPRGRAGFFCQSGALGVTILENVTRRGLGLSTFVSAGNRADVSGNDLLQYWEEDDTTEVVLLYLESLGNPRKFSRIARRVSRRKPVIAVKSGRATQGVPLGHAVRESTTGQAAVDAMFKQAGVIQVDTLDDMFDVAQLLAHQPLPAGRRVAVVGNSDAILLLAADAAASVGLDVTVSVSLGANASADDFERALDRALDSPDADSVLVVYVPVLTSGNTEFASVIAAVGEQSDKPVLSTFLAAEGIPELLRVPDAEGSSAGRGSVPSYQSPETAVRALARACDYAQWRSQPAADPVLPADVEASRARAVVDAVLASSPDGRQLTDAEATELLAAYGIELWPRSPVATEEEAVAAAASLGWEVVLKATTERVRQRPDLAHVFRSIQGPQEMTEAWSSISTLVGGAEDPEFIVQRTAPPGVSVSLVGIEDPLFGPIVTFGVSGP
ncbi:MAG: GNAT family N-acetyltransferase, partial [Nocardioidaceae bacterium]